MRSSTFAIEVIIERLKRDCDLIPSVKCLGTPCLVHENAVLIIGIFERSSRNTSTSQLVNESFFFQMSVKYLTCSESDIAYNRPMNQILPLFYSCCKNLYFPTNHDFAFSSPALNSEGRENVTTPGCPEERRRKC